MLISFKQKRPTDCWYDLNPKENKLITLKLKVHVACGIFGGNRG